MPRYDYRCDSCGEQFEVVQSFSDPTLTECPHCGTSGLKKVFGNVGVVFKGSGFYRNDSREAGKKKSPAAKGASAESASSGKPGEKKDSAPAKASDTSQASATSGTSGGSAAAGSGSGATAS